MSADRKPTKNEERGIDMISHLVEEGDAQSASGNFSEASMFYARALKISLKLKNYSSRDILFKTVQSCIDNHDYDTALKILVDVVKESDEFSLKSRPILKLMGMIHGAKGDLREQVKCYDKIIKLNRSDPEGYILVSKALIRAGKKKKAGKYLDNAVKRVGRKDVDKITGIAGLYSDLGDPKKSLDLLVPFSKDYQGRNEYFWYELGRAYFLSGSRDEALEMSGRAVLISNRFPEAMELQGDIFQMKGDNVMARERYQDCLSMDGTNKEVLKKLQSVSGDSGTLRKMADRDKYL
ncbi:MAG: tetratricopeptide repeat protein [Thermoplasmatota archaeon]